MALFEPNKIYVTIKKTMNMKRKIKDSQLDELVLRLVEVKLVAYYVGLALLFVFAFSKFLKSSDDISYQDGTPASGSVYVDEKPTLLL